MQFIEEKCPKCGLHTADLAVGEDVNEYVELVDGGTVRTPWVRCPSRDSDGVPNCNGILILSQTEASQPEPAPETSPTE